jgi:hypothetical protein
MTPESASTFISRGIDYINALGAKLRDLTGCLYDDGWRDIAEPGPQPRP